jgi:hypothetical protein
MPEAVRKMEPTLQLIIDKLKETEEKTSAMSARKGKM